MTNPTIDRSSSTSFYLQIRDWVIAQIQNGILKPGDRLPSSRTLSAQLGINRNTVSMAYHELVADGLCIAHVGRGTFIADTDEISRIQGKTGGTTAASSPIAWEAMFADHVAGERFYIDFSSSRSTMIPGTISFAGYFPDEDLMPIGQFEKALVRTIRRRGRQLFKYTDSAGYYPLRCELCDLLARKSIRTTPEQVIITNGSQQALYLVAKVLLNHADTVIVEEPTYTGALRIFRSFGCQIVGVPVDGSGMDTDHMEAVLTHNRAKLIYTIPDFQNPTGTCLSIERRKRLLALAEGYGVPILEDDFVSGLRFEGEELPPLAAMATADQVIYAETLSKNVLPGLRIGWLVAPTQVAVRLAAMKHIIDINTSPLLQAAVLDYITSSSLETHLERVRQAYRERRDVMIESIHRWFPQGTLVKTPQGGMGLWVQLHEPIDTTELFIQARRLGVLFSRGELFHSQGTGRHCMRLTFSNTTVQEIRRGIELLGSCLMELISETKSKETGRVERVPLL
jgi:2-aminoadipate transaminase